MRQGEANDLGILTPITKIAGMNQLVKEAQQKHAVTGWRIMNLKFGPKPPIM